MRRSCENLDGPGVVQGEGLMAGAVQGSSHPGTVLIFAVLECLFALSCGIGGNGAQSA